MSRILVLDSYLGSQSDIFALKSRRGLLLSNSVHPDKEYGVVGVLARDYGVQASRLVVLIEYPVVGCSN